MGMTPAQVQTEPFILTVGRVWRVEQITTINSHLFVWAGTKPGAFSRSGLPTVINDCVIPTLSALGFDGARLCSPREIDIADTAESRTNAASWVILNEVDSKLMTPETLAGLLREAGFTVSIMQ